MSRVLLHREQQALRHVSDLCMRTGLYAVTTCARVPPLPEEGRGYKPLQTPVEKIAV